MAGKSSVQAWLCPFFRITCWGIMLSGMWLGGISLATPAMGSQVAEGAVTIKPTEQLPQVIVAENLIQQATRCIQEEMAAAGDTRRYTVEPVRVPPGLRLPWGNITYSCTLPNGIRKARMTAVNVDVLVNGVPYARMVCSMRVRVYEKIIVAASRIQKETPIKAEQLMLSEREDTGKAFERYTDVNALVGKVVSSNVAAGTVIHSGMIKEPIMITPFSKVNISTNVNGVEISIQGTALERGRRGDYIMVQNDSSRRSFKAKVIDENNVQVVQ